MILTTYKGLDNDFPLNPFLKCEGQWDSNRNNFNRHNLDVYDKKLATEISNEIPLQEKKFYR